MFAVWVLMCVGKSVKAWIDYTWTGSSSILISQLVKAHNDENWTLLNGWTASGLFAMNAQIGSKNGMYLESSSSNLKSKENMNHKDGSGLSKYIEEKKFIEAAIDSGELKPVNPNVVVRDKDENIIWTGKADEWTSAWSDVYKQINLKK
ncbi:hypothetical protein ABD76_00650 [Paenibacillus dendritiformis]|nr:hypothetical protein [Paenibacillus dendritiformis]